MHPWPASADDGEPVIDLGTLDAATSEDEPPPAPPAPPERPAARWLLVCATVVVTVLATLAGTLLYQRLTAEDPGTPVVMPTTMEELQTWLTAESPAGVDPAVTPARLIDLMRHSDDPQVSFAVTPGTYRLYVRCGVIGAANADGKLQLNLTLLTTLGNYDVALSCPSVILPMTTTFTFTELGAVQFDGYLNEPEQMPPFLVATWLAPVEAS